MTQSFWVFGRGRAVARTQSSAGSRLLGQAGGVVPANVGRHFPSPFFFRRRTRPVSAPWYTTVASWTLQGSSVLVFVHGGSAVAISPLSSTPP